MSEPLESYWQVVDPVWDLISIDDPESFAATTGEIPRPVLHLYAAYFADSEICNGGFLQFFSNSTGILAPEAIEGFRAIGMPRTASVVQAATEPLGNPFPRDRSARWKAMLARSGKSESELDKIFSRSRDEYAAYREATEGIGWRTLEDQYYALIRTENGGFESAATEYANRTRSL